MFRLALDKALLVWDNTPMSYYTLTHNGFEYKSVTRLTFNGNGRYQVSLHGPVTQGRIRITSNSPIQVQPVPAWYAAALRRGADAEASRDQS